MRARAVGMMATTGIAACTLCGCASMSKAPGADYAVRGSQAAGSAVGDTYSNMGDAAKAPLQDFNLMHDAIPPILVRAYARPYDNSGLDTCSAISEQVRQLDLALGPDVDIPAVAEVEQDVFAKGASFAADAALDAAKSATTGVIPLRSWVRRISGANKAEARAKAVALAGSVRRGYLKALGQMKSCDWPASPLAPQVVQSKTLPGVAAPSASATASVQPALQPVAQTVPTRAASPQR